MTISVAINEINKAFSPTYVEDCTISIGKNKGQHELTIQENKINDLYYGSAEVIASHLSNAADNFKSADTEKKKKATFEYNSDTHTVTIKGKLVEDIAAFGDFPGRDNFTKENKVTQYVLKNTEAAKILANTEPTADPEELERLKVAAEKVVQKKIEGKKERGIDVVQIANFGPGMTTMFLKDEKFASHFTKDVIKASLEEDNYKKEHGTGTEIDEFARKYLGNEPENENLQKIGSKKISEQEKIDNKKKTSAEPGSSIKEKSKKPATKKVAKMNAVKKTGEGKSGGGGFVESSKVKKDLGTDFRQL